MRVGQKLSLHMSKADDDQQGGWVILFQVYTEIGMTQEAAIYPAV
jgi:hypothetical protein